MSESQDAALYCGMWGGATELFSLVGIEDFDPGDRQELAVILERGALEGADINLVSYCKDEAIRLGRPNVNFVTGLVGAGFTGTVGYYANKVRQESIKRAATAVLTRSLQRLGTSSGSDIENVLEEVRTDMDALPRLEVTEHDTWTLDDLMGLTVEDSTFTLPQMLKRNERLVLTGTEGGGKSVFIYQMLTGAAFGVDTFKLERNQEPQRVMFIDVENNEFQARSNLDKIVPQLREAAPDVHPAWFSMKQRVVNLLATQDKSNIIRRVVHYKPDILYMGTAYKLTDVTDDTHRSVRAIQNVVDRIRQEIDCSVIIEHHAGHGMANDRNGMRPEGSSYWLRWPDAGRGMIPKQLPNDRRRFMMLKPWRGDRATDRNWPVALLESPVMPWEPIYRDRYDSQFAPMLGEWKD
jgi:replicative DNA helicase